MEERIYVLVTTEHRGVFVGYMPAEHYHTATAAVQGGGNPPLKASLVLTNCRNVIYFAGKCGFLGLAKHGPQEGSRIGSTALEVLLHDVTSVSVCTPEAERALTEWTEVTK